MSKRELLKKLNQQVDDLADIDLENELMERAK